MSGAPIPILALDTPTLDEARRLLDRIGPAAEWVKVGLQLFTAEGPVAVRALHDDGRRVFLDLKLHDIPNTVAHAVRSASGLGVELLTVHASGGRRMLEAAREASGDAGPRLLAVTVLTSLSDEELGEAWGRDGAAAEAEVPRLAALAASAGIHGIVCSVHEASRVREVAPALEVLTPGIRLPGDAAGDQTRVATPADAARAGARYLVLGRSVTHAPDPHAAYGRLVAALTADA